MLPHAQMPSLPTLPVTYAMISALATLLRLATSRRQSLLGITDPEEGSIMVGEAQQQEARLGAERAKWREVIDPQSLCPVMYFLQQSSTP